MPLIDNCCAHAFSSCRAARPWSQPRQRQPDRNEPSWRLCHEERSNHQRRLGLTTQKQSCHKNLRRPVSTWMCRPWQSSTTLMWTLLLICLLLCCSGAHAEYVQFAKPFEFGGAGSTLLFDRSQPPIPAPRVRLERRQQQESISGTPSLIPAPTAAGTESSSLYGLQTETASPRDDLPTTFDTSLGNNFTSPSCPAFFQSFLTNSSFQDCLPLSLLLQTSNSFFTATRSRVLLTRTLDHACSANFPQCSTLMSTLATQIQQPSACADDFAMQNPQVRQAYNGFLAYEPLYRAGCLTNEDSGDYCFVDAVNNASAPNAVYMYYLPLGVGLPTTARLGCSSCLQDTMSVFSLYANQAAQPLRSTYSSAATQVDDSCGSQFAEAVRASANAAPSHRPTTDARFLTILFMIFLPFVV